MDPERVDRELANAMNAVWFEETPGLRDFAEGRVPKERLARFAASYLYQVEQFKRFIAAIYANAPPRDVRELMLENLLEEHGDGDPARDHTELVARFVRALGAEVRDVYHAEPIAESVQWIDRILAICKNEHFVVGLAAVSYGIEARTRTMAFQGALYRDAYGIAEKDLEFFFAHVGADEEHAARAKTLIRKYCVTESLLARSVWAVGETLDATRVVAKGFERVCAGS
jgi:pyrroloquinoline-quinone synthase